MPEAHLFFTALTYPHFIAGTTFLTASVWLARLAFDTGRFRFAVVAGLANLALGVVYPFLIYLIGLILLLYWLFRSFELRRPDRNGAISILIALAVPAPLFFYYFSVLQSNPVIRAWDAQAITPSPNPLHYLLAYGVLLILAVPTMLRRDLTLLWLWVFSVALLLYAPLNPQRRFVEGVRVPLRDSRRDWSNKRLFAPFASNQSLPTACRLARIILFPAWSECFLCYSSRY